MLNKTDIWLKEVERQALKQQPLVWSWKRLKSIYSLGEGWKVFWKEEVRGSVQCLSRGRGNSTWGREFFSHGNKSQQYHNDSPWQDRIPLNNTTIVLSIPQFSQRLLLSSPHCIYRREYTIMVVVVYSSSSSSNAYGRLHAATNGWRQLTHKTENHSLHFATCNVECSIMAHVHRVLVNDNSQHR